MGDAVKRWAEKGPSLPRVIGSKILMKENMNKCLKFKIETFSIVRDMICECE